MNMEIGIEVDEELLKAYDDITMPRTEFALRNFVVGEKDSIAQAYCQCVLEANIKVRNLKHARLDKLILEQKIKKLRTKGDPISLLKIEKHMIDLDEMDRTMLGARRELKVLQDIFREFGRTYTREEIDADQPDYWRQRLSRQAALDYMAHNRVMVGNLDALRMANMNIPKFIDVPITKTLGYQNPEEIEDHIEQVERKYLENGNRRILVAIPTVEKLEDEELLNRLLSNFPIGVQIKQLNVFGKSIVEAYTIIFNQALVDGADYVLTIEDDTFAPKDALGKLLDTIESHDNIDAVGAWYPRRNTSIRESTAIMIGENGKRCGVPDDGFVHEVVTLPAGFTLFKTEIFKQMSLPWFASTPNLTQDSFFSQKAIELGFHLWIDASVKAQHVDRATGVCYE